jgi:glycosyltransferase involved in cell wall biosynthesis
VNTVSRRITALVGRLDEPTDGVRDFCHCLSEALRQQGVTMGFEETAWAKIGWRKALRQIRARLLVTPGDWVLLQFTGMAWSRRGFPFGVLTVARKLRNRGARLAVVFHEPHGFRTKGIWARFRFKCQEWIIHHLYRISDLGIFTVSLSRLNWIASNDSKARFIPIGSNMPAIVGQKRDTRSSSGKAKTVAVFGVTNHPRTSLEVAEISRAVLQAKNSVSVLRLIVFGRGAMEARKQIEDALRGAGIELSVFGVLPAEQVSEILSNSDVLLYVRDELTSQHGSTLAAVACGIPIVAYGDSATCYPISEAGILLAPSGNHAALSAALIRVLSDDEMWNGMHERSIEAHRKYFAWTEIARRYASALEIVSPTELEGLEECFHNQNRVPSRASSLTDEGMMRGSSIR